jgi:phytoene/squalene synthetase
MEHWQDVGEDARRGRVYLPREDRERHGVTVEDLTGVRAPACLRALLAEETAWARSLLDRGSWLVGSLSGAARWATAGYVAGGMAAGAALARAEYDPLGTSDVRPRRVDVLRSACWLLVGRLPGRPLAECPERGREERSHGEGHSVPAVGRRFVRRPAGSR